MRTHKAGNQQGLTLLELIISIMIIGILAAASAPLLHRTVQAAHLVYDQQQLLGQGRLTLNLMAKHIRNLSINDAAHFTANPSSIKVTDLTGDEFEFHVDGTNLIQTKNATVSTLQPNTSNLSFHYYNGQGEEETSVSNIRYVRIILTLSHDGESETLRTTVFLRNATDE